MMMYNLLVSKLKDKGMGMLKLRFLLTLITILAIATPALAVDDYYGAEGGSQRHVSVRTSDVSPFEVSCTKDVDLTAFLGRLYDVMTKDEYLGQYPQVKQLAGYLKDSGVFSLATANSDLQISGDSIYLSAYEDYEDLDPASYVGRYLALPDSTLRSANYVAADDVLLYTALTNVTQKAMLEAENMAAASKLSGGGGENNPLNQLFGQFGAGDAEQAMQLVKALRLDQIVGGVLTGEVALALYGLPPMDKLMNGNIEPYDVDAALMIGIKDPKYLVDMIERYGREAGLQGQQGDGGWYYYSVPQVRGAAVMFNNEMLIATTNAQKFDGHIRKALAGGGLRLDPCQLYFDLNMARLEADLGQPLMAMAQSEFGSNVELPKAATAYLLDLPANEELGHLRVTSYHDPDGMGWELSMQKAVPQYMLYYFGVIGCGAAQKQMGGESHEQAAPDES